MKRLSCTCVRLLCLRCVSHCWHMWMPTRIKYICMALNKIHMFSLRYIYLFPGSFLSYNFFFVVVWFVLLLVVCFFFLPDTITNNIRLCIIYCFCSCYCLPMCMPLSLLIHRSYGLTTVTYKLIEMAKTQRSYNKMYMCVYAREIEFLCVWRKKNCVLFVIFCYYFTEITEIIRIHTT